MLRRYDTLIIDEAHERSLNIDFILGYLRQLLPRRPDLKVIVTSATIDTERFARHFADADGTPAPIVEVTGRTFPVEVRYRPFGEEPDDERDQVQAIVDAVDELGGDGPGDVLVFLSGEREIHDTADALRRGSSCATPRCCRCTPGCRRRRAAPHLPAPHRPADRAGTNVAETSITVPGVRYVVDAGTARISRYSRRLKVQRLPIEPISQASADQRAGRCGRVAAGICIRLYAEDDYVARPEFTEPEILRTNLASVILQMTAIGLGDVAAFPFVEPPDAASIRDGYLLLEELGAIVEADDDGPRRLTDDRPAPGPPARRPAARADGARGRAPRVRARGAGDRRRAVDPGPAGAARREHDAQAADELHRRFDVPGSDLLSIVALWDHLREQQRALSSNQFRRLCRDRVPQLPPGAGVAGPVQPAAPGRPPTSACGPGTETGHPDHVHQSVLAGLLSHLGLRDRDTPPVPRRPRRDVHDRQRARCWPRSRRGG